MDIRIEEWQEAQLPEMLEIWNHVVEEGEAFPQEETLDLKSGRDFFASQSFTAVAMNTDTGQIVGLYILHPNNIGRCSHLANASYAVHPQQRGLGTGEKLVRDSLLRAREKGFTILQFNAVVAGNLAANKLYAKLGFTRLGMIPHGFRNRHNEFEDIILYYHEV